MKFSPLLSQTSHKTISGTAHMLNSSTQIDWVQISESLENDTILINCDGTKTYIYLSKC